MNVLNEILDWSTDRPMWQRDSLRRLIVDGDLSPTDIGELTSICKGEVGLTKPPTADPLAPRHLPDGLAANSRPVTLESLEHLRGVNALAENQTLHFGPQLTVVYGDNGAGKTGYTRILKMACRARKRETVLGNVVEDQKGNVPPSAVLRYHVEGEVGSPYEWTNQSDNKHVSRISIFDSQSAAVYITEKTDVAFRPFGLDIFDQLVNACQEIRAKLDQEAQQISSSLLTNLMVQVPPETQAGQFIRGLSLLTDPNKVDVVAAFTEEDAKRFAAIKRSIADLNSANTNELTAQLRGRLRRLESLAVDFKTIEVALGDAACESAINARNTLDSSTAQAEQLREATLSGGELAGTGTAQWKSMWEAARQFANAFDHQFPIGQEHSKCMLCQQEAADTARERLRIFEAYVTTDVENALKLAQQTARNLRQSFASLTVPTINPEDLQDGASAPSELPPLYQSALASLESRKNSLLTILAPQSDIPEPPPMLTVERPLEQLISGLKDRLARLSDSDGKKELGLLEAELAELRARQAMSAHRQVVIDEIERLKKVAAYKQAQEQTQTRGITLKSNDVTRQTVTERLKLSFTEELKKLKFRHMEVQLQDAGGSEGVFYHQLALTRAGSVALKDVVSEGEQRCLSIAAFFSELSTADDTSAIVFDDPISSLDFNWREGVANRLVIEAQQRQVIVFTHDIVFLLRLKQLAGENDVECHDQHIRHSSVSGAGVSSSEVPWVAMKLQLRLGHLKQQLQDLEKLFRDGFQDEYERRAKDLYGYLREAWERALEEVLLGGIVERFRPSVQTMQVGILADITESDCTEITTAMTKCSRWLRGHDESPAARTPVPGPDELRSDINSLAEWSTRIRKRRK